MPINKCYSIKSCENAEKSRAEGNKLFVEKCFFDALLKYNESLCYAEKGSGIGLAYANRSAVYFEMKFFEKSLKNIELARLNGYPQKNISILDKRAAKCVELIKAGGEKKDEDPFEFIKLSHEVNPKLTFVANCLELRRNDKFGRYVITNKDLKVGDIVAIEKPQFKIIKSDSRYDGCLESNRLQRCAFCLKSNLLDLIPCETCSSTMYCSELCLEKAWRDYHRYECPIVNLLHKSGVMQMAMIIFFQALSLLDDSITELERFFNENESSSASVYDFDLSNNLDQGSTRNYLISLLSLARNQNDCSSDSPERLFKIHPVLSNVWETHESFIRRFIARILQIGDWNFHGICGWSLKKYENKFPQMIGIGCYPFISLVNHSCAPNVNRIYIEDNMLLLVERPIKRGEQLFDCYKNTFFTQPKNERQFSLRDNYGFSCDCIACSNDFPIFHRLKPNNKIAYKAAKKAKDELSKLDVFQAKNKFGEYCVAIQKYHESAFPSSEIVLLQECILQCLSIIIKPNVLIP